MWLSTTCTVARQNQLLGGFHSGQRAVVVRDISAAAWLENGDTVTALLKRKGMPIPPRSKDGAFRIGYCKPTRNPIEMGLLAASMEINPHCIMTDQQLLERSARKGDTVVCLAGDRPSKRALALLSYEGVAIKHISGANLTFCPSMGI